MKPNESKTTMTEKGIRVYVTNTGFVSCTNVFSDEPNGTAFTDQQLAELKQEIESEVLDDVLRIFEHGFDYPDTSVQMSYKEVREKILEISKKGGQE